MATRKSPRESSSDPGELRTRASALVGLTVLIVVAGFLADDGSWDEIVFGASVIAAPYGLLTLVARWASPTACFIVTVAMVALTAWAVVGLESDAQAAVAFIFVIPLQVFLIAGAGWRLLWDPQRGVS